MVNALWITLIGMGLVFAAIIVLWGVMALLVRLTAEKESAVEDDTQFEEETVAAPEAVESGALLDRKRRAAAAAVAVALSLSKPAQPARPVGSISAWQAGNRANPISPRAYSSRKKVGR
jgi:Na+-transporting methylmalonyl-CoA/oxaloacetate decarboxylase gamma subunit